MNHLQNRTILQGDVLEKLKEILEESIDCIITSPPYWGLRDYKVEGQWGLEKDFREYLEKMQQFMDMAKVVLKKTGTCWINLGDTYAGGVTHSDFSGLPKERERPWQEGHRFKSDHKKNQIQTKSQFGIPQRFYADCIDNDWIARNFIPWIKDNSMPSSVKDRFTNKWEPVMFFTKQQKYYFNLDAIREKSNAETKPFNIRVRDAKKGLGQLKLGDNPKAWKMSDWEDENYNEKGEKKQDVTLGADSKPLAHYKGFNERWQKRKHKEQTISREHFGIYDKEGNLINNFKGKNPGDIFEEGKWRKHYDENGNCLGCGRPWQQHTVSERAKGSMSEMIKRSESICWCNPRGKNPGDVFRINPRPFPEAHFATFPVDLPLKILKCACPDQICKNCGIPREPIIESNNPSKEYADYENIRNFANTHQITSNPQSSKSLHRQEGGIYSTAKIIGWTRCDCNAGFEPGIVLDPFFGAGTVGVAAEKLGLNWIGIELSDEYVKIARRRLEPYNNIRLLEFFEMTK